MKLTLIVGGMFSGKSSELQRQGKRHMLRGHNVVFVKPDIDKRYSEDEIVTHDGQKVKANVIGISDGIEEKIDLEGVDVVLIDEIQFFTHRMIMSIDTLLRKGIRVYCAGLDLDYTGSPFGITPQLMAKAENVIKLHAVCDKCGGDAWVSSRESYVTKTLEIIDIGEKDKYFPVCRKCLYEMEEKRCVN